MRCCHQRTLTEFAVKTSSCHEIQLSEPTNKALWRKQPTTSSLRTTFFQTTPPEGPCSNAVPKYCPCFSHKEQQFADADFLFLLRTPKILPANRICSILLSFNLLSLQFLFQLRKSNVPILQNIDMCNNNFFMCVLTFVSTHRYFLEQCMCKTEKGIQYLLPSFFLWHFLCSGLSRVFHIALHWFNCVVLVKPAIISFWEAVCKICQGHKKQKLLLMF